MNRDPLNKNVRVDEDTFEKLRQLKFKTRKSYVALIREAVDLLWQQVR